MIVWIIYFDCQTTQLIKKESLLFSNALPWSENLLINMSINKRLSLANLSQFYIECGEEGTVIDGNEDLADLRYEEENVN